MAGEVEFKGKGQALRLGIQQELGGGPLTIFGAAAQKHDLSIREVTAGVLVKLAEEFPNLEFQLRTSLSKREINAKLSGFDPRLGQALFVESASIRPDGGITEVKDRNGKWRVVLVGESKHQGNDVEKILAGVLQGKNKDQDFMAAGNAIERMHKNVLELRNFMLDEKHFPYVVFLQGSNFATESFDVTRPDGRVVRVVHDSGLLNRIDRLTASSLSREINQNYCENITVRAGEHDHMFQIASLYCKAHPWEAKEMADRMLEVARTSLRVLANDLDFGQNVT
ncbi:type II restriction enzyme [Sphingomonas laterariae]|uniref:Type II restriction enzyme n=1 Tax=Edaphosphingomonas laterariae TaxID=861865 RepID=A0A239EV61_9SPHN|nr:EcoRI family type II restriction endonuclease [Sphingomonas laterariae]SNS47933.1 type II restriction enzyme [Sphingomonas laterariae]